MLSKVCSAAVNGVDAYPVEVEVNSGYGDTVIVVVGLPDAAVKESKDRREGTRKREARAGDRRGRRPLPTAGGTASHRQVQRFQTHPRHSGSGGVGKMLRFTRRSEA